MRLLRSSAVVGGLTMISRILGFVRDQMLAAVAGDGPIAEAFVVALRFPNLFRRLFAEGAFNAAFVPLYAGKVASEGDQEAALFLRQVLSVLIVTLSVFVVLAQLVMPWLILIQVPGWDPVSSKFQAAILFTQITMPYILLMSVTAMLGGVLNSYDRFVVAAGAPVLLNIILISILATAPPDQMQVGLRLSIGVTVSGIAQAGFLYWGCVRSGIKLSIGLPKLTPGVKRLIVLGVPGAIAAGVTQINIIVSQMIASGQDGAVALLYYADRLYQLPLGVIGIAMGVALLPMLTKRLRDGDGQGASNAMNRALEMSMALTLPAAIAMFVIPNFLVEGLFERGEFDAEASMGTAMAVRAFAAGLPAFVMIKVFAPGFFAREDTKTPMRFAAVSMIINVVAGLALFTYIRMEYPEFGHVGLAAATSVAGWVNAILLMIALQRRDQLNFDARLLGKMPRILIAAGLMGGCVWFMGQHADAITAMALDNRLLAVVLASGAGAAAYAVFCVITGAVRPSEVIDAARRR